MRSETEIASKKDLALS